MKITGEIFQIKDEFITIKADTDYLQGLNFDEKYSIEFKKYRSNRSIEQNKMMWGIIQQIAKQTDNDIMDIYCEGLEKANAKSEFMMCLPEAIEEVKKCFRAVKICETREYNGKNMAVLKCYIGSSKYNSKEMTELIDYFIRLASEWGIVIKN